MDREIFGVGRTFILTVLAVVLTWLGVYLNMFDPSVFETVLMFALPTYGAKTIVSAVANRKKG